MPTTNRRAEAWAVVEELAAKWRAEFELLDISEDLSDIALAERVADYLSRGLISEKVAARAIWIIEDGLSPRLRSVLSEALP